MSNSKQFLILLTVLVIFSCKKRGEYTLINPLDALSISYAVPHDLPSVVSEEELAVFAWNEFVALNWQAEWTQDRPTRTTPDETWTFANGDPEIAVWETYIHRTELRPANGSLSNTSFSSGLPSYSFSDFKDPENLTNSKYWVFLDEDNEIGSAYLFANKDQNEVLYMAKTNLVEANYLKNNYPNAKDLVKATKKTSENLASVTVSLATMCESERLTNEGYVCLPCGDNESIDANDEGAIEIKMALRKLTSKEKSSGRYMMKKVLYYKNDTKGKKTAVTDTYGVIGMHIIHKTKNHPTFVFASWEQVDVRNNDMQTLGIDTVSVNGINYNDVDPHRLNPVIERSIPESIRSINTAVHSKIRSMNPTSTWQYYQLIGAQATPVDYKDRNDHSNYFMANYVIESDLTLTNFHGSFSDPFNKNIQNVASNGKTYNMGGCMGCHGRAQNLGSDFSFLVKSKFFEEPDVLQTYQEAFTSIGLQSKEFTVFATKSFQSTGVFVDTRLGNVGEIKYVADLWTADPKSDNGNLYDANGNPNAIVKQIGYPLQGVPQGALVGKIGDNPVFLVGNGVTKLPLGQKGELQLSINDDLNGNYGSGLADNQGAVIVEIITKN